MDKALDTKTLLEALASILKCTRVQQYNVIANDQMHLVNFSGGYPICFIQNTDEIKYPGTHWVAYFIESPGIWEFFDSYGELPSMYNLSTPPGKMIEFNSKSLQSIHSSLCGHFSLHFLYFRSIANNYFTFKRYKEMFEFRNDLESVVRKFYANLILHSSTYLDKCQSCVKRRNTNFLLQKYYPSNCRFVVSRSGL